MAKLLKRTGKQLTLEVTVNISGSLLEAEDSIQQACNEIGQLATQEAITGFDTDGSPLMTGSVKWTNKGQTPHLYQTPYGAVEVLRYVYQTSKGGRTWCPLDDRAHIIRHATPLFAKQLTHKYAFNNAKAVCSDLEENHGRPVTKSYVQNVVDWVGGIAQELLSNLVFEQRS